VNALKKDGTIQFEKIIRDTAKIHGITLPGTPGKGLIERLVERFTAPLRRLTASVAELDRAPATGADRTQLLGGEAQAPTVRASLKFTAGALLRKRVANEIRRYLDETGLKYELHEYKSWTSSDFLLTIDGPQDEVQKHSAAISNWLNSIARN
jgi:hypothetical protein